MNGNKIRKVTPGGIVTTLAGSGAWGFADGLGSAAIFDSPSGVAVDGAGNVYVADTLNNRIRKITPGGLVTTLAGSGSSGGADGTGTAASFLHPAGMTIDGSGNLYVGDTGNNKIRKVTPDGVVTTLGGSGQVGHADGTGSAASFARPWGVAVDGSGSVYVADALNHAIRLGRARRTTRTSVSWRADSGCQRTTPRTMGPLASERRST
jgi:serine/threonine protein kinase, bacterial